MKGLIELCVMIVGYLVPRCTCQSPYSYRFLIPSFILMSLKDKESRKLEGKNFQI